MKTQFLYLLLVLLHIPAWGQKKDYTPTPVIPIDTLQAHGIIAYSAEYKRNYPRIMPYLYYNSGNKFNEIQGDFVNVDYGENSSMNLMVGYFKSYGKYKNSLVVLLAKSPNSKHIMGNVPVYVRSNQFGKFEEGKLSKKGIYNKIQERALYVKQIPFKRKTNIFELLKEDVITVNIAGQIYTFLTPEVILN